MSRESQSPRGDVPQVRVPKEIFNADSAFVIEWLLPDGAPVEQGSTLCELETSKSTVRVESEHAGYLRHAVGVGDEVAVGGVLGFVSPKPDSPLPETTAPVVSSDTRTRISGKARRLIQELGLNESLFEDRGLVRESDVLAIAAREGAGTQVDKDRADLRGPSQRTPLGLIQRRVTTVMEKSTQIPTSYMERSLALAPIEARAKLAMEEAQGLVTVLDVVVWAISHGAGETPHFNGFLDAGYNLTTFSRVNVGLAVDVENDLFVVVVKDAASKPLEAIAAELRGLQYKAQRRRLTPEEMAGGTITVTSMLGRGIDRFQPLLYPEQSAIVGVTDGVKSSDSVRLTLGFDHRVANGAQAAEFLRQICEWLT
jgi:pyruvate/2-oxoglutarate dehydrogenase complex dihydrolipoamide acyltransferase (E2) component